MIPFSWVGNHPGLDLVNTVKASASGQLVDLLPDWAAVTAWVDGAGLADAALAAAGDEDRRRAAHATVVTLRDALRALLEGDATQEDLDAHLAAVPIRLASATGPPWVQPPVDADPIDRVLVTIALAVVEVTGLPAERVRRCANHECVLRFHDTTRGGGRRWCDMATCGNRAKQAAHTRRQQRAG